MGFLIVSCTTRTCFHISNLGIVGHCALRSACYYLRNYRRKTTGFMLTQAADDGREEICITQCGRSANAFCDRYWFYTAQSLLDRMAKVIICSYDCAVIGWLARRACSRMGTGWYNAGPSALRKTPMTFSNAKLQSAIFLQRSKVPFMNLFAVMCECCICTSLLWKGLASTFWSNPCFGILQKTSRRTTMSHLSGQSWLAFILTS